MNRKMHAPGLGRKVGGAGSEGRRLFGRGVDRLSEEAVLGQEESQSGAGESASRLPEKLAPGPSAWGEAKSVSRLRALRFKSHFQFL